MKRLFILFSILCLAACAHQPIADPVYSGMENGCLPDAIEMVQGLHAAGIKAEVVRMDFDGRKLGHAIAAYIYPTGSNTLYVWDKANGSFRIHAYFDDPLGIAQSYAFGTQSAQVTDAGVIQ